MWSIILFIAVIYLIIQAFKFNLYVGIGAVLAVLVYGYYKWYAEFCTAKAKSVYPKDAEKALAWFERGYKRGMSIGQKEAYAYYLLREGEVEKSERLYNSILAQKLKHETRLRIRAQYAVLLLKTDRLDEAIDMLEEITVNYVNTTTYGTLGYLYILKNNRRKAESYNKEAYDYNSTDPVILDNCTELYIKMGKINEAKKYADELIERKPYFAEAYYDSAFIYAKLCDFEKAEELIEEAKKCRLTFMSNVTTEEIDELSKNIQNSNTEMEYKLGTFSNKTQADETEETEEIVYYDDETITEYETFSDIEDDENDPFI